MIEVVSAANAVKSRKIRGRMLRVVMATLSLDSRTKIYEIDEAGVPDKSLSVEDVHGYGRVCITAANHSTAICGYEGTGFVQVLIDPPGIKEPLTTHSFYGSDLVYAYGRLGDEMSIRDADGDDPVLLDALKVKETELEAALSAVDLSR